MVHYVHVTGRQHGDTSTRTDHQIERLEERIKAAVPEGSKWHGMFYHRRRKRADPSRFRKGLIFAFMGHKGLKRLDEIWYHTWTVVINLEVKGDFNEALMRTRLKQEMTVERIECTTGRPLDAVTKCMLQLKNRIPWLEDGQAKRQDSNGCHFFGIWFEVGRHI